MVRRVGLNTVSANVHHDLITKKLYIDKNDINAEIIWIDPKTACTVFDGRKLNSNTTIKSEINAKMNAAIVVDLIDPEIRCRFDSVLQQSP